VYTIPALGSKSPGKQKSWLHSSLAVGEFMSCSYSMHCNSLSIFSFVDLIPCFCLFVCPLSGAGLDSGRYFLTAAAVNP
jgi:hypothetical protein